MTKNHVSITVQISTAINTYQNLMIKLHHKVQKTVEALICFRHTFDYFLIFYTEIMLLSVA